MQHVMVERARPIDLALILLLSQVHILGQHVQLLHQTESYMSDAWTPPPARPRGAPTKTRNPRRASCW